MEKAVLVIPEFKKGDPDWAKQDLYQELRALAESAGLEVVGEVFCRLEKQAVDYFVGKGKAGEIAFLCAKKNAAVAVFNVELTAVQLRNLEAAINAKIIDRTQLILDIFAKRARSREGRVQVELAQLSYLLPRLGGKGVLLSRLGGGIGTRGPGEQKLETDKRRIRDKISRLKEELGSMTGQRQSLRMERKKYQLPVVALVGYTNAGKSTLFNGLTGSGVMVMDKLFATPDPTIRRFALSNGQKALLVDTVGFLHNLPHHLIEAFKATLEEVSGADMLVLVLDISHPKVKQHYSAVLEVLKQLKADDKPIILALNKIDNVASGGLLNRFLSDFPEGTAISALKKEGLKELARVVSGRLSGSLEYACVKLPIGKASALSEIYQQGIVSSVEYKDNWMYIQAQLPLKVKHRFQKQGLICE